MNGLIERLRPFGQRFILVEAPEPGNPRSGKRAVERGFQLSPHKWDSPRLQRHIEDGGNYGILAGQGLIIIDLDVPELGELFPDTLTVESGSGKGQHLYYRSDCMENGTIYSDGENVGNVQARYKYVVGPGGRHHSGGAYRVHRDMPVAWISKDDIAQALANYTLKWASSSQRATEDAAKDERDLIGRSIPIDELVDMSELTKIGRDEWQGSHPIHGSRTGQNFSVNLDKNSWHCFRDGSGGGPLLWLAVKNGLLDCSMAKPGALRGQLFLKTLDIARDLGYPVQEMGIKKTLPPNARKFFTTRMSFIPKRLADEIVNEQPIYTLGSTVYIYDPDTGIYRDRGEAPLKQTIYRKLGEAYKSHYAREVVDIIKFETALDEEKEVRPELLAVENGLLDVLQGELRPFSPDYFSTTKIPVVYDPDARSEVLDRFISESVHPEDVDTLQEFCGSILLRDYRFKKLAVLHGPSHAGKSVFAQGLRTVLGGDRNVSSITLHDLISNRFAAAQLHGKLANFGPELNANEVRHTGKIRALTGGDTLTAEFKGRDGFQFINHAKQLYICNDLPRTSRKETTAFFDRCKLVRFPHSFRGADADRELIFKLTKPDQLSGWLNWMIAGLARLVARGGFKVTMSLEDVKEQYLIRADPVGEFIRTQLESSSIYAIPKDQLHAALTQYCLKHGARLPSKRELAAAMKDENISTRRVTVRDERIRCWGYRKLVGDYDGLYMMVEESQGVWSRCPCPSCPA